MLLRRLFFALGLTALIGSMLVATRVDAQPSPDGSHWLAVHNNSSQTIVSIQAAPPPRMPETTDPNLIAGYTVPPGGSARIRIDAARCVFNIRLSFLHPKHSDWTLYNFNVCAGTLSVGR